MTNKIGIGYITCNAPDRVVQSLPLIPAVDRVVLVNDGLSSGLPTMVPDFMEVIQHGTNRGVGASKNDALRYLMQEGCDHLFLIEDDVLIKNPNVFLEYIHTAEESGIWHLNYALQGPGNRAQDPNKIFKSIDDVPQMNHDSEPVSRGIRNYATTRVALYQHLCGAFSYYYRGIINNVGYFDESYCNAMEHIDHTYKIIKKGLHPPFWWFADIANAQNFIGDIPGCVKNSVIRKDSGFKENIRKAGAIFAAKYGTTPVNIADTDEMLVMGEMNRIQTTYARKVL